jgi:hypothetical protein
LRWNRPAPSLTQCPAVVTIRLVALLTTVPEQTKLPPVALVKNTLTLSRSGRFV